MARTNASNYKKVLQEVISNLNDINKFLTKQEDVSGAIEYVNKALKSLGQRSIKMSTTQPGEFLQKGKK